MSLLHWTHAHAAYAVGQLRQILREEETRLTELLLHLAALWQAWRLAEAALDLGAATSIVPSGDPARRLVADVDLYWAMLVDPGYAAVGLAICAIVGVIGVLWRRDGPRAVALYIGLAWWLYAGAMLTIQSPGHVAGGLYLLLAGVTSVISQRLAAALFVPNLLSEPTARLRLGREL